MKGDEYIRYYARIIGMKDPTGLIVKPKVVIKVRKSDTSIKPKTTDDSKKIK